MDTLLTRLALLAPLLLTACIDDGEEYPNPYVYWDTAADTGDTADADTDTDTDEDTDTTKTAK